MTGVVTLCISMLCTHLNFKFVHSHNLIGITELKDVKLTGSRTNY